MNLKQKLSKKLKKTGGFTLIEMLIVVAIIAILVAVSIPMVNSSLDKARTNTDAANLRSADAVATISAIEGTLNGEVGTGAIKIVKDTKYMYDISEGMIIQIPETGVEDSDYGQSSANREKYIIVTFEGDDLVPKVEWGTK